MKKSKLNMKNMPNLYHLDCIVYEATNTLTKEYAISCLNEANREMLLGAIKEAGSCEDKQEAYTRLYSYLLHYFDLRQKYDMPITERSKNSTFAYLAKIMKKENITLDTELIADIDQVLAGYNSNKLHCS